MSYKFLSLLFLIYLSSTYCSDCTDKTTFEEGEDESYACESLTSTSPGGYYCHYNSGTKRCEEIYCSSSSAKYCTRIPNSSDGKRCLRKGADENSGCEYKACSDLTSNCNQFFTGNEDEICTLNSAGNQCEIKLCSSLTSASDCGQLTPYYPYQKCAFNSGDSKCAITIKDCEELGSNYCNLYTPSSDDGTKRCLPDSSNGKCKKASCEELSKTECSKYIPDEVGKVCIPDGNNCRLQSCSEISPDICETIEFDDPGSKCVKSGTSCTFSTCDTMTESTCGDFIPINKLFKCYYEENAGRCITGYKECSDFARGECDLFNTEDNLEDTDGAKCVESDGKCTLGSQKSNSKMLEFPAFISLIVLLLL